MNVYLYAVKDRVSHRFNAPFVAANHDDAKRSFNHACAGLDFGLDMELYFLGLYSMDDGSIIVEGTNPEKLCDYPCEDAKDLSEV